MDIIEKLVQEMMDQRVIQHNTGPYASLVVMVGENDGSWKLCIDYKELNHMTVKDKFPIPNIEDLLDELGGACNDPTGRFEICSLVLPIYCSIYDLKLLYDLSR